RASLDAELEAERSLVRDIGAKQVGGNRPLAAEAELTRLRPLLAHDELVEARDAADTRVRDAGRRTCTRLQSGAAEASHLAVLVTRYCAHFGVAYEGPPPLGPSTFEITGTV